MANRQSRVHTFPSTTWEFRKVRVRPAPPGQGTQCVGGASPAKLRPRRAEKPLSVTVRFRGGPEASWLIEYRGVAWRFPGHVALHDALTFLQGPSWAAE